ncbi:cytokine-inducible SH2-containing protein [Aethina tumida]|uniref:cytokine-inducible SH2-containing protein n=1 Tax=Aethina tumida TaxID=116153 RepID=UPI00096B39F3|nr:cytokine-inducible SH2-containing protein [Aethina tumida]
MLGCSATCPNCRHEFTCCTAAPMAPACCSVRRSMQALSGGGLVASTPQTSLMRTPLPDLLAPRASTGGGGGGGCASPQVSPSAPLAFVIPSFATPLQLAPPPADSKPETELQKLRDTVSALRLSGFYYEGISYEQANDLLKDSKIGTFLVRNSSDPRFLFSLSVQTERGPTSVRLFYINGYFRLDAQQHLQSAMPMFPSVIELVQHYVNQSKANNAAQVWVDPQGKWYSSILLERPLRKKEPGSLKHLARVAIHKALEASIKPRLSILPAPHTQLDLPKSLTNYLSEYPYSL